MSVSLDVRFDVLREYRLNQVRYLDHLAIRSGPLHSAGFFDCNGLVLLAEDASALAHYDLSRLKPKQYVPLVLEELSGKSSLEGLHAVVVGGSKRHFNQLKNELEKREIPVAAEYCDSWGRKCRDVKSIVVDDENCLVLLKAKDDPVVVLHDFKKTRK